MLIFASIAIVRAVPIPTIFLFLGGFQEKFTNDVGFAAFYHLSLLFPNSFCQLFFSQLAQLFSSDGVHDKLNSLVDIQIDFLRAVKSQIVGIDTLFTFLAEPLLEIGTYSIRGVIILIRILCLFQAIYITIECI